MQDFSSAIKKGAEWAARLGLAPGEARLSLIELAGLEPAAAGVALRPAEAARLARFACPARQRQWLGGRLAVKQALLLLAGKAAPSSWPELAEVEIGVAADERRPLLIVPESPPPLYISISHSGDLVIGLAARFPCGIDLQVFTPRIIRVAGKFSRPAEMAQLAPLAGNDEVLALTLLWTAKESIMKSVRCRPMLTFNDLELADVEESGPGGGHTSARLSPDRLYLRCRRAEPELPAAFTVTVAWDAEQAVAVTLNPEHFA